jgi:D-tyrosyl-tRNA(Tyr) deacylase
VKALLQRVSEASVTVDGEVVGAIGCGLVVLLGVARSDDEARAGRLADKVARLRVFDDDEGRMGRSLLDVRSGASPGGEEPSILCVSQFTLYGDVRKGLRPSFTEAAEPEAARSLYELFCRDLEALGIRVETGIFGARMSLSLKNEGPVTLLLEV